MKALLLALALLTGYAHASTVEAQNQTDIVMQGCSNPGSGTVTYLLLGVSPTVMSSVIDLGSFGGVYITVTGTAQLADVLWGNSPNAISRSYILKGPQSGCLPKLGRYLKVRSNPINLTSTSMTAFVETFTGAATAGSQTSPNFTVESGYLNKFEGTTTATSSDAAVNLSSLAAVSNFPLSILFSTLGPCTGVYWNFNTNPSGITAYHFLAASATAILRDNLKSGSILHVKRAGATDCTVSIGVDAQGQ